MVWCSLRRASCPRRRRPPPARGAVHIARDEAVHAAEEAVDALRRRRPVQSMSFSGGAANSSNRRPVSAPKRSIISSALTTLPLDFDIFAPSLITMPCVNRRFDGLVVRDQADVAHHLGEEARVDQVQNGVLDAADVLIDRKPVGDLLRIERRLVVLRDRSSGRNTRTNRRTCPWCRSRAARRRRTWDTSRSRTPARRPAATGPCR